MSGYASLNGNAYKMLPPEFVTDLVAELQARNVTATPAPMPDNPERDFDQTVQITIPLKGLSVATLGGSPPVVKTHWAFEKRDGSTQYLELTVPEELRQQLNETQMTGQQVVTGAYQATLDQAITALNAEWGLEP